VCSINDLFSESSLASSFTSSGRGRGNEEGNLLLGPTRGPEDLKSSETLHSEERSKRTL
jgi:hypothetical protein